MLAMLNILTFDVEDWYQGLDLPLSRWGDFKSRLAIGLDVILEALSKHATRATFFVLGRVAQDEPTWVQRLMQAGHELGSHGWDHTPLHRYTRAQYSELLKRSLDILQSLSGQPVQGHRAAFFSVTKRTSWALEEAAAAGMRYDSSIFPVHNHRYGWPEAQRFPHPWPGLQLWEFPPSTLSLGMLNLPFGGGFYARLWPYAWLSRAIRHLNEQGQPAVVYFHPWEFDVCHPRLRREIPWLARTTHYYRLHRSRRVLEALLNDFQWTTMGHFLDAQTKTTPGVGVVFPEVAGSPT